jgi:hypothetical protein
VDALRLGIAVAVFAIAVGIAWWLNRNRRSAAPSQGGTSLVPEQLDRSDFPRPEAPWLVALFTSTHCDSCHGLIDKAAPLESADVVVTEIEYTQHRDLHHRYHIDAAPITVVADAEGVTQASFVGAFEAGELWAALAALRES